MILGVAIFAIGAIACLGVAAFLLKLGISEGDAIFNTFGAVTLLGALASAVPRTRSPR